MKHHTVQDKYLEQWKKDNTPNHLNIYFISENKIRDGNTKTPVFWKKDFNVLNDKEKTNLPEEVSAIIDTKGIGVIRQINIVNKNQLTGIDRSSLAFYIALQRIRTPKYREEFDKVLGTNIKHLIQEDISSPDKVNISKKDILRETPKTKQEKEALEKIRKMSEEEIKEEVFKELQEMNYEIGLTKTGHSKNILKISRVAKDFFEMRWLFLLTPKDTSFITSDNPCFVMSGSKIINGIPVLDSRIIFPLRPDVCLYINPKLKSKAEIFLKINKTQVRDINKLILSNSYECAVAKDKEQLNHLVKRFNYMNHKKTKNISVDKSGNYTMFKLE